MKLPTKYSKLSRADRVLVRNEYVKIQNGNCWYCKKPLIQDPPERVLSRPITRYLFSKGFFDYPIHLQHDHYTDLTEGAVHAYCNAVLWEYYHR